MIDRRDEFNATELLDQPEALRERAGRDGFLFFQNLLPAEPILELRRQALELVKAEGLLDLNHELMDGLVDLAACADYNSYGITCISKDVYAAVQRLPLFHEMAHHPNIVTMFETLFGEEVLIHPRHIMRLVVPAKNVHATAPHQDIVYIHGTPNTWTTWVPLGDCPIEIGNLTFLRGSHKADVLPVMRGKGAGGLECDLTGVDGEWIHFNYQVGDLVTFSSKVVHKSVPTQRPERIRLSLDYRFQPVSEPVHVSSLEPHMGAIGWGEIYREWPEDTYKYYWKKQPLTTTTELSSERYPQLKRSK